MNGAGTRAGTGGFTLLEVILSLSVFALVATAVVGTLHSTFRTCEGGREALESLQAARIALERFAADLRGSFYSESVLCSGFVGEDESDGNFDTDRLTFVTTASSARPTGVGVCDLTEVEYFVGEDEDAGEIGLCYRRKKVLLAIIEEDEEPAASLAEQIVGLNLRYFGGLDWEDSWDASARDGLPQAIEITVWVREGGKSLSAEESLEEVPTRTFITVVAPEMVSISGESESGTESL